MTRQQAQQQMMNQQIMMMQMEQQRQSIMAWQKYLTNKGYDPGPIDGINKPQTSEAYQQYLRDQQ